MFSYVCEQTYCLYHYMNTSLSQLSEKESYPFQIVNILG